jgi:hypothetical protein
MKNHQAFPYDKISYSLTCLSPAILYIANRPLPLRILRKMRREENGQESNKMKILIQGKTFEMPDSAVALLNEALKQSTPFTRMEYNPVTEAYDYSLAEGARPGQYQIGLIQKVSFIETK